MYITKLISALFLLIIFLLLSSSTDSKERQKKLTILVNFTESLDLPSITENEVVNKLQIDLQKEFAPEIKITVEKRENNFLLKFREVQEIINQKYNIDSLQKALTLLIEKYENSPEPPDLDYRQLKEKYSQSISKVKEEITSLRNLAGFSPGTIGLSIQPSNLYGGRNLAGEYWSFIYIGYLEIFFPPNKELKEITKETIDYSSTEYDSYRGLYNEEVRKKYMLQYIANNAKQQIGLIFSLPLKIQTSIENPMKNMEGIHRSQYFKRDEKPLNYESNSLLFLKDKITEWINKSN